MKTLKTVLNERPEYKRLIKAVINNVGIESVEDINRHGIDAGFGDFIYYDDTVAFYKKHKKIILKMAQKMADDIGEDMLNMVVHFNCLTNKQHPKTPDYTSTEIGEAIFAGHGEYATQILNAMAWFAAEEVCRMFEEE
jgi:hypothetical protein